MSLYFRPAFQNCVESLIISPRYCFSAPRQKRRLAGKTLSCNQVQLGSTMELKGRRLRSVEKGSKSSCNQKKLELRITILMAVSGGALEITVTRTSGRNIVAQPSNRFKYKNLNGEKTILSALCNWLTSLMLCVSSFLYCYGHFMGFIFISFGVMAVTNIKLVFIQILAHSQSKETIMFAPYKFSYTELGVTKKCRWSYFKLG